MDLKDIDRLAKLSRLSLSESEKRGFLKDFGAILEYVGEIKEVAAEEPKREAGELRNVMRPDREYTEKLSAPEDLVAAAPERENGYVKVDQVL